MDTAFWPDFPLLAAPTLWERLTPDLVCPEIINDRLYRTIRAEQEKTNLPDVEGLPFAVAAALGLAKYLEGFPPPERGQRFEEISRQGMYHYGDWLLKLIERRGKDFPAAMIWVADVMADCENGLSFLDAATMLLSASGQPDQAIERARAMLDKFGDEPWSRILAGDVYRDLGDLGEAKRLYLEGLAMACEPHDWQAAVERLQSISKGPEGEAELAEILRRHPIPGRAPAPPTATARPAPLIATNTVSPPPAPRKKVAATTHAPAAAGGSSRSAACAKGSFGQHAGDGSDKRADSRSELNTSRQSYNWAAAADPASPRGGRTHPTLRPAETYSPETMSSATSPGAR